MSTPAVESRAGEWERLAKTTPDNDGKKYIEILRRLKELRHQAESSHESRIVSPPDSSVISVASYEREDAEKCLTRLFRQMIATPASEEWDCKAAETAYVAFHQRFHIVQLEPWNARTREAHAIMLGYFLNHFCGHRSSTTFGPDLQVFQRLFNKLNASCGYPSVDLHKDILGDKADAQLSLAEEFGRILGGDDRQKRRWSVKTEILPPDAKAEPAPEPDQDTGSWLDYFWGSDDDDDDGVCSIQ